MANTLIRFNRGGGLNSNYITTANFTTNYGKLHTSGGMAVTGVFDRIEPWFNTSSKQLWVDAVCINPKLVSGDNFISFTEVTNQSGVATITATIDTSAIAADIVSANDLTWIDSVNSISEDYSPLGTTDIENIYAGTGVTFSYNNNTKSLTINNDLLDSFLDDVYTLNNATDVTAYNTQHGTDLDTTKQWMIFTFNISSGSSTHVDIQVDISDLWNDINVDTKTRIDNVVGNPVQSTLTTNSGVFTDDSLNIYNITHSAITAPTDPISSGQSPTWGNTFNIISGANFDGYGHLLSWNTTNVTLPSLILAVNPSIVNSGLTSKAKWTFTKDGNTIDQPIVLYHVDQTEDVTTHELIGTDVAFTKVGEEIAMHIQVIDGGLF